LSSSMRGTTTFVESATGTLLRRDI
jgi:hypothetical protein